jgi:hypothetical protein
MMQKRTKRLIWIAALAVIALISYFTMDIEIIHNGIDEVKTGESNKIYHSADESICESNGHALTDRISAYVVKEDKKCFVSATKDAYFAEMNVRDDIARQLAALINSYYQRNKHEPVILRDAYVRLEVLNFLTPYVLRRDLKIDARTIHSDALREVNTDNLSTRRLALAVLSYYRDNGDIHIFKESLKNGGDEELVMAMAALVANCSPIAKKAISDGLAYENVRSYLTRYRDKETITRMIETECRLDAKD